MTELEKDIVAWHKKTFPNATIENVVDKIEEEILEYEQELFSSSQSVLRMAEELADVFIVAIRWFDMHDMSLSEEVARKLEINKGRVWDKNGRRVK